LTARSTEREVSEEERLGIVDAAGELAGAAIELVHNTAELAACESRVIVRRLAVRAGLFFGALLLATSGVLLMLEGAASYVGEVGAMPKWLAFVLTGFATTVVGALAARWMIRKLGDRDLAFPGTLAEIKSDVESFKR
jgi:hypothetical protein